MAIYNPRRSLPGQMFTFTLEKIKIEMKIDQPVEGRKNDQKEGRDLPEVIRRGLRLGFLVPRPPHRENSDGDGQQISLARTNPQLTGDEIP